MFNQPQHFYKMIFFKSNCRLQVIAKIVHEVNMSASHPPSSMVTFYESWWYNIKTREIGASPRSNGS